MLNSVEHCSLSYEVVAAENLYIHYESAYYHRLLWALKTALTGSLCSKTTSNQLETVRETQITQRNMFGVKNKQWDQVEFLKNTYGVFNNEYEARKWGTKMVY